MNLPKQAKWKSSWVFVSAITPFLAAVFALQFLATVGSAAVLFDDNFDAENGGTAQFSYANFTNWDVTAGQVDLIGSAGLGDIYPGHGLYVDLDGSPGQGRMETKSVFNLSPGQYRLSFEIGNNPRVGPTVHTNSARIIVADVFSEDFTRTGDSTFDPIERFITVNAATSGRIIAQSLTPADFAGIVLDRVRLERVPEPVGCTLFAVGIAVLIFHRHRWNPFRT